MIYFAYGSNMSTQRMTSRVPSAELKGTATLFQHKLAFHKISKKDGSGKCDAYETEDPEDKILGVLYQINPKEKSLLDRHEGYRYGYDIKNVSLINPLGENIDAFTYYATNIDTSLKPYSWYLQHILSGMKEHRFPSYYIEFLKSVESVKDMDQERERNELSIYY